MSATIISKCNNKSKCVSEYQDKKYGKGKRVHNKKDGKEKEYTCTVCGSVKFGR